MICHLASILMGALLSGRAPDSEYSSDGMIAKLAEGKYRGPESGVPADFECTWRKAAMVYATKLNTALTATQQQDIHDSLELETLCDSPFILVQPTATWTTRAAADGNARDTLGCEAEEEFVHCVATTDEFLGALAAIAESNTMASAAAAAAGAAAGGGAAAMHSHTVKMSPGVYRLNETLVLGVEHSNTVVDAPAGGVTITGASELKIEWKATTINGNVTAYVGDTGKKGLVVSALRVNGERATRARYPNANPETDQFPAGWITSKSVSIPPVIKPAATVVDITLPGVMPVPSNDRWGPHGFAQEYRVGRGGPCSHLTPAESYWCQPNGRVADTVYMVRTPSGIANTTKQLPNSPYKGGGANATVIYWRPGHWFTIMYELAGPITDAGDLHFGRGGYQGAEGHDTVAEWYIENVFEELDSDNEFFYEPTSGLLYYKPNSTSTDTGNTAAPPPRTVEAPMLAELIVLKGSIEAPVKNVTITGITFTGQRPTYMDPHGLPSGGDWGLERLGAIRLNGTEDIAITDSLFHKLDGNAIFVDGYNRRAGIHNNEFTSLGASAIAQWGYEHNGKEGLGDQPRFTNVTNNVCHVIGIYQKQSSCFFQAVSTQSYIHNNIFYNMPRAGVNFNDGFGGGHDLGYNMIWNTCRESSDHGAFNSWDRQPYATTVLDGKTLSARPQYSKLHHNWIVANYAADGGCYDNDDGSSWYLEQDNFCIYGGMKSNFEGHNKRSTGNLHAFASVYGDNCVNGIGAYSPEYSDAYANNTCILTKEGDPYLQIYSNCDVNAQSFNMTLGGNTIYAPNASVRVACNGEKMSGAEWLKASKGWDAGTSLKDSESLTSAHIVAIGEAALAK